LSVARANQGIAKVRKVLGVAKDKRGVDSNAAAATIAREFKKRPEELKAFSTGTIRRNRCYFRRSQNT
jgi:hypothetical protein